ncbi:hypothetical protein [Mycoplana sp. MJR14]|uniref:hypothetical protein n=1 Tax=Mycoplana sp. MJR14 TaxID=3032583 RepID=UPI0023DB9EF7|nr:hypothetical protein [Mycoplana sp. MJR14]MDF1631395.1 hypothetical protein [Mycoplana sp. MJR14]
MNDTSLWDWNLTCLHGVKDIRGLDGWSGREGGTRLAAKACEDAYDDATAGKLFGTTQQDVADIQSCSLSWDRVDGAPPRKGMHQNADGALHRAGVASKLRSILNRSALKLKFVGRSEAVPAVAFDVFGVGHSSTAGCLLPVT